MPSRRSPNEGTIHQLPSGSWRVQVRLDGQRLGKTFRRQAQAKNWLNEISEQIAGGLTYDVAKITLGEFVDDWYAIHKTRLKVNTQDSYARTIRLHIKPNLGDIKLLDLTPAILQNRYNQIAAVGITTRPLQIAHSILHQALDHACRLGLLARNPSDLVILPTPEMDHEIRDLHVWTESQVSSFILSLEGQRNRYLYQLALAAGMRRGELVGLQWSAIDFLDSTLTVRQQVVELPGGGWKFQSPKTRAGRRTFAIGPGLIDALRAQISVVDLARQFAQSSNRYTWEENDLVFPSLNGTPQNGYNLSKEFDRLARAAGLPDIRFHDMRHTAASIMLANGIPLIEVSRILGHSKPSITLDIYGHFIPGHDRQAALLMDSITTPVSISIAR